MRNLRSNTNGSSATNRMLHVQIEKIEDFKIPITLDQRFPNCGPNLMYTEGGPRVIVRMDYFYYGVRNHFFFTL